MGPDSGMILPKGIVINNENIYQEVASLPTLSVDQVLQYWRVYTTTNKKLQDPTARRLENFWWHVLGSDRRHLSGQALARIYEDISKGTTCVSLEAPPSGRQGTNITQGIPLTNHVGQVENGQTGNEPTMDAKRPRISKEVSCSALRPPPAHPILKKPSGPSAPGPRPTARFVSPPASDGEDDEEKGSVASGDIVTPALEVRAPIISPSKKKTVTATKKFVASSGKKNKRRPVLARKPSSQSSGISDTGSRSPRILPVTVPPIVEAPVDQASSNASNAGSSESREGTKPSVNALGKRPMVVEKSVAEVTTSTGQSESISPLTSKYRPSVSRNFQEAQTSVSTDTTVKPVSRPGNAAQMQTVTGQKPSPARHHVRSGDGKMVRSKSSTNGPPPSPSARTKPPSLPPISSSASSSIKEYGELYSKRNSLIDLTRHARGQPIVPGPPNKITDSQTTYGSVPMVQSRSHTGYVDRKAPSSRAFGAALFTGSSPTVSAASVSGKGPTLGLFTGPTATTTTVAAQGTIIDQSGSIGSLPIPEHWRNRGPDVHSGSPSSSLLEAHFTPTPPSSSASIPLGRTRSQLTLLLERANASSSKDTW